MRQKIAIIVQRYGNEINGGAELHAKLLAERLNKLYDVTVLTSCANDYVTWKDYYPVGEQVVDNIKVWRFHSEQKKEKLSRRLFSIMEKMTRRPSLRNYLSLFNQRMKYWKYAKNRDLLFNHWIRYQGPYCVDLIDYLKAHKQNYAVFVFFTYLYYPTYAGLKEVSEKSILIPTAHDEKQFYIPYFESVFSTPAFIMYNTLSEKKLVERTYPKSQKIPSHIAGVGFDQPQIDANYSPSLQLKDCRYIIYIGRVVEDKGCHDLIDFFASYKEASGENVKLVMVGKNQLIKMREADDVIFTGFVEEQEKLHLLQNSEALIIPSKYESFSMVTLEAMTMGKPVIAEYQCEVLRNHIEQSQAGFLYKDQKSFISCLSKTLQLSEEEKQRIRSNGQMYVQNNYQWDTIIDKFKDAITHVAGECEDINGMSYSIF